MFCLYHTMNRTQVFPDSPLITSITRRTDQLGLGLGPAKLAGSNNNLTLAPFNWRTHGRLSASVRTLDASASTKNPVY